MWTPSVDDRLKDETRQFWSARCVSRGAPGGVVLRLLDVKSGRVAIERLETRAHDRLKTDLVRARFDVRDTSDPAPSDVQAVLTSLVEIAELAGQFLELRTRYPDAAIIAVIDDSTDASRLLAGFRHGVSDAVNLAEPVDDIVGTVNLAIERRRIALASSEESAAFTRELGIRARSIRKAYDDMELAYEETLHALVRALDVREKATAGHSVRVTYYTCYLARLLGVTQDRLKDIYRGSLLHDIGKIGIPDAILLKPGKLTSEEFKVIETHAVLGREFLRGVHYLENAIEIPYAHHERWSGRGYPLGLEGEEIPLAARIFAVADVYDALRSRRCYKEPYDHERSLEIIASESGKHFDPRICAVFLEQDESVWKELDEASRGRVTSFTSMLEMQIGINSSRAAVDPVRPVACPEGSES